MRTEKELLDEIERYEKIQDDMTLAEERLFDLVIDLENRQEAIERILSEKVLELPAIEEIKNDVKRLSRIVIHLAEKQGYISREKGRISLTEPEKGLLRSLL